VTLCVYDQTDSLAAALGVAGAGALCGDEPCWRPIGEPAPDGKGFVYEDDTGSADGVRSIRLKGGSAGRSSLAVEASNSAKRGQTALPTGITEALRRATQVTLQLQTNEGCFETTLTEIRQRSRERFKAK
jgi:hypothetical protein